jgi:autotransporter-associated beta strand protein
MNQPSCGGIFNLNGGTMTCRGIHSGDMTTNYRVNNAYVNFHGGTLIPSTSTSDFIYSTITGDHAGHESAPQLMVYSEGAVIDTDGKDITINEPLIAPPGQGVSEKTIILSGADRGEGYRGEPVIRPEITPGDLTNVTATAVANMEDDETGNGTFRIKSITITNPGVNYSETAMPTLNIYGGDATTPAVLPALTIAPNVSGGLTKKGAGILTLSGDNTYTGDTIITAGTLALAGNFTNNIASSPKIKVASGATLDVMELTDSTIVIGASQTLKVSDAGTVAGNVTGSVEMEAGSAFEWEYSTTLGGSGSIAVSGNLKLDTGWKLNLVDSGGTPAFGSTYDLFTYGTFAGDIAAVIDSTPAGWPTPTIIQDSTGKKIYVMFGSSGDINGDGVVDAADYIILKQNFGQSPPTAGQDGDFDGDGLVEWDDLQTMMANFGTRSVGGAPAAPEPGSVMLLMFGAAALLRRRQR